MASERDAEFLGRSSNSSDTIQQLGSSWSRDDASFRSGDTDFTESSPAVLEPSKDASRSEGTWGSRSIFKKILTRSLPQPSSDTSPIVHRRLPSDSDVEQQTDEQVEEHGTNCCTTAYNCYKNSIIKFRNSAFMYILQLLFSAIPVSAIVMGTLFVENCPKAPFLPAFGAVIGIIGLIVMALWLVVSCLNRRGTPCSAKQRFAFGVSCFLLLIVTTVDAVLVYCLSPKFDPTSKDYCNETFYTYAFYKEIASAAVVILSALFYIPGSRHSLCCQDCSMRSPANPFYYSL